MPVSRCATNGVQPRHRDSAVEVFLHEEQRLDIVLVHPTPMPEDEIGPLPGGTTRYGGKRCPTAGILLQWERSGEL
jgi:hypothetical protein